MITTERFSDRAADYVRPRPDYPQVLLAWLRDKLGVTSAWRVADAGVGTGISSKLFLDAWHAVVAMEPNAAMRAAAIGGKVNIDYDARAVSREPL